MTIIYRPDKKLLNANALSRKVIKPCGSFGRRALERCQDFSSEVDYVIPLVSLFSEENTQTGFPEAQPSPDGLAPPCREFLTEGPIEQSYEGVRSRES